MHAYTGAKLDVSIVTGLSANSFWAELVVDDSAYTDMMTLMERWEWDTMVSTPDVGTSVFHSILWMAAGTGPWLSPPPMARFVCMYIILFVGLTYVDEHVLLLLYIEVHFLHSLHLIARVFGSAHWSCPY